MKQKATNEEKPIKIRLTTGVIFETSLLTITITRDTGCLLHLTEFGTKLLMQSNE